MEELFGVPTEQLMWTLLAVFGVATLVLTVSALRNRVSFRMAARNLPRRRTQTVLVVLGLMLATMLFSASFTTGDTLTNSLRVESLANLGQVDVRVQAKGSGSSGQQGFGIVHDRPLHRDGLLSEPCVPGRPHGGSIAAGHGQAGRVHGLRPTTGRLKGRVNGRAHLAQARVVVTRHQVTRSGLTASQGNPLVHILPGQEGLRRRAATVDSQ